MTTRKTASLRRESGLRRAVLCGPLLVLMLAVGSPVTPLHADELLDSPLLRVILISSDTLSARHLATHGYHRELTATLDSLASEGVTFTRCLTPQGWTLTAHMSMFTGLSPGALRVGKNSALGADVPILAELLAAQGFLNGAFLGANNWLAPEYGFERGFSIYRFQTLQEPLDRWGFDWLDERFPSGDARALLKQFFLFFHFMEPHSRPVDFEYPMPYWAVNPIYHHYLGAPDHLPTQAITDGGKQWDMAAYEPETLNLFYDASIYYWDMERLRGLLRYLTDKNLLLDTLLIVTADHGEEIAEHGGYFHDSPQAEVRDVPLVMVWPGHLAAGSVVDTPVSLMDITPTILDLANLPPLEHSQGISLRPVLEDPAAELPPRDFLIDGHRQDYEHQRSALVGYADGAWWSLVASTDTTTSSDGGRTADEYPIPRVESPSGLYCLDTDPFERTNLRWERRPLVRDLRDRMRQALARDAALAEQLGTGSEPALELPDKMKKQLEALGY